jgi:hypothetical protein
MCSHFPFFRVDFELYNYDVAATSLRKRATREKRPTNWSVLCGRGCKII